MIDVQLHYRNQGSEKKPLPLVPRRRDYISGPAGSLWVIDSILLGDGVHVFAVRVAGERAADLEAAWAGWDETETSDREPQP
jgi:hypothetical protein